MRAPRVLLAVAVAGTIGLAAAAPAPAELGGPAAAGPARSRPAVRPTVTAPAATAAATSVTLGQTAGSGVPCGKAHSGLQTAVSSGPSYTAPFAGVITSFSYHAGTEPGQVRALLFVPTSSTDYQLVAKSAVETAAASVLSTFPTRLPVPAGAILGSQIFSGAMLCAISGVAGDRAKFDPFNPTPRSRSVPRASSPITAGTRLPSLSPTPTATASAT